MQKTVFQNQNYNNFKNPVRGNNISTTEKPKELPIPIVNKTKGNIKLIVTEGMINKIRYICGEFPTKEWSGVLFYDIKGSLKKSSLIEFVETLYFSTFSKKILSVSSFKTLIFVLSFGYSSVEYPA